MTRSGAGAPGGVSYVRNVEAGGGGAWLGGARNRYNVVVTHLNREWGKREIQLHYIYFIWYFRWECKRGVKGQILMKTKGNRFCSKVFSVVAVVAGVS